MSIFKRLKHYSIQARIEDEKLYEQVLRELESGFRRDGLWAQALEKSMGDPDRAMAAYIRLRVQSLRDESEILSTVADLSRRVSSDTERALANFRGRDSLYDNDGHTALMRAVLAMDLVSVRSLLEAGADRSVKDGNFGTSTALDMAKLALRRTKNESDATALRQIIQELQR